MAISRSSALSMNVLLIFYMYDLNGALFLNARSLCTFISVLSFSIAAHAKRSIVFSQQYKYHYNHTNLKLRLGI